MTRWSLIGLTSVLILTLLRPICYCSESKYGVAPKYDRDLLASRLNMTIETCKNFTNQDCALNWINKYGDTADYFTNILNRFTFSYANRMNKKIGDEMLKLSEKIQIWTLKHLKIARRFQWSNFTDYSLRRRFKLLTMDTTLENDTERREFTLIQKYLLETYSKTAACPDGNRSNCLPAGEHSVMDAMVAQNSTYDYKIAVWRAWYDASALALADNFTRYVELANKAAKLRGFADAGEADWLPDFESPSFPSDILVWNSQLSDLYRQLHAYVRHRLSLKYPGKFDPAGCLPAHILGHDQWGQHWLLPQEDFPHPQQANSSVDYSKLLQRRFGNFTELVRAAEEFYTSIGMKAMTPKFWSESDFLEPQDPKVIKDCHASAWEFASTSDYRIKMCGRVNREDFYVIHHEMGHIEYFMAYSEQPREFRAGANSGFHEAVGDTMALSVDTKTHYATLGLVNSSQESKEEQLNSLFSLALGKIAFLPFALTTGAFRWMVFNGTAIPRTYNRVWWKLRADFGGVCPPVDRPESGFDAGAKYHVALDISYIRYYFSFILQFQLHRRMCQLSGHRDQINRCDFYRSRTAGEKFWKMLTYGNSRPWKEVLKEFTGEEGLQTSAILEYFKPVHDWLIDYNRKNKVPVGWTVPNNVLKGV